MQQHLVELVKTIGAGGNSSPTIQTLLCVGAVLLGSCANPERERYEETLAAVEIEEQRLIEKSRNPVRDSIPESVLAETTTKDSPNQAFSDGANVLAGALENDDNALKTDRGQAMNLPIPLSIVANTEGKERRKNWWVLSSLDLLTGKEQCLVVSQPMSLESADQFSRIQLMLTEKALYVFTEAEMVREAPQVELRVDANSPVAFEGYVNDSVAVIAKNYTAILNQLLTGNFISVSGVFFTDNDLPNLQIIEFELKDFITAYAGIDNCTN